MKSEFKIELISLLPIFASLVFGVLCAFLLLVAPVEVYGITPFPEGVAGSFGNAFYFVVLVAIGASLLYLLLKFKSKRLIEWITGFALTLAIFMLSVIYFGALFSIFAVYDLDMAVLGLSVVITVLGVFAIFWKRSRVCNLVVLGLGGALGTFLGFAIPSLSAFLILVFLAVYDVFAVYHGPVGKIAHKGLEQFRGLSFSFRDVQMGLGDLTFYSMLCGHMLLFFGVWACLASMVGVLVGCVFAFRMLERRGMFPGLPFPIFLGLALGLLVWLL
jgi:presenilin-like A22 family membrane protease